MMAVLRRTRTVAATTLQVTAGVLGGTAKAVDVVAKVVRPSPSPVEEVAERVAAAERVRVRPRVVAPDEPDIPTREPLVPEESAVAGAESVVTAEAPVVTPERPVARVAATHVEELAERPAAEVIARIPELSTEELRLLTEHEERNRRRKTVLAAIQETAEDFAG